MPRIESGRAYPETAFLNGAAAQAGAVVEELRSAIIKKKPVPIPAFRTHLRNYTPTSFFVNGVGWGKKRTSPPVAAIIDLDARAWCVGNFVLPPPHGRFISPVKIDRFRGKSEVLSNLLVLHAFLGQDVIVCDGLIAHGLEGRVNR